MTEDQYDQLTDNLCKRVLQTCGFLLAVGVPIIIIFAAINEGLSR